MPRRNEFGSVTKTRNRFTARYTGPDGNRYTPGKSFATKTEATGWLAHERRLIDLGTWTPPALRKARRETESMTLAQWVDEFHDFLGTGARPLRESTLQNYRNSVKLRVTGDHLKDPRITSLANAPLTAITKADAYRWWQALNELYPDTPSTNHAAYKRLRAAGAAAVEQEILPANPIDVRGAGSKPRPQEKHLPEDWEIKAIIEAVPERYKAITVLILHHGLRIGEAIALERSDIIRTKVGGRKGYAVKVRQNAQRIHGDGGTRMVIQPPKTEAGKRTVPIFPTDAAIIEEHLKRHAPQSDSVVWVGGSKKKVRLLTATATGNIMLDTSYRNILARARESAGVYSAVNPHTGRNWLITRLAENGAHVKEIGNLLGQDDLETIMRVYMKVSPGRPEKLMEAVSASIEASTSG